MVSMVEFLGIPGIVAACIIGAILVIQVIGEIIEFFGKSVPELMKIRKYFKRKKQEKIEQKETLAKVQQLLSDVNGHYSEDNIAKRDKWMEWVNDRADVYDKSIDTLETKYDDLFALMDKNNFITLNLFLDFKRSTILDFAAHVCEPDYQVSQEYFNKIFKIYNEYEALIEENDMQNGEVDIAYKIISDAYMERLKTNSFIENKRGY